MPDVAVRRESAGGEFVDPPGEVYDAAQIRNRLTDAATRVASETGYLGFDVDDIVRSAGLSVREFHRHFASKEQCMLAAYDRFLERLLAHVDDACGPAVSWPENVKAATQAAFEFVRELESVARMFAIEATRIGPAALDRKCASIESAALRLKRGRLLYPAADRMSEPTERTLVAGVVMLVSILLLGEEGGRLAEMESDAVEMLLTPFIGVEEARAVAIA
jgi:AcrR family transcriptional regulator